jgi:ABC-2 type transport system permease protein
MKGVLKVCREEFRSILSDSGAVLILVGAVVFYSIVYPIPYRPEVLKEVPVVVVDLDRSALSRRLIRMVEANEYIRVASRADTTLQAEREVLAGRVGGLLVVPEGFERDILRGQQAHVGAFADASYLLVYRQVITGVLQAVRTLSAGIEIRRFRAGGMSEAQALAARDPLPLVLRPVFNPAMGYATYVVPAVLLLILQQTLLIGIGMLSGTERERAAPESVSIANHISAFQIVLGKAAAYFALYVVHCFFYFGILSRVYHLPQRADPGTLILFLLPFLIAIILMGLGLSNFFKHRETAMQALLFMSIPAIFLSGFAWPPEATPKWLRVLSYLLPSTAGISGFLRVNQMGASLQEVRFEWLVLWILCALYLSLAWGSVRRNRTCFARRS